jgi:C2 domain
LNQLLNISLFELNGGKKSGYILKSPMLRGLNNVVERKTKMLVEVISGMQIPQKLSGDKDIVDPYVTVHLISTSSPTTETLIVKTAVVKNNGLNPIW